VTEENDEAVAIAGLIGADGRSVVGFVGTSIFHGFRLLNACLTA
jgi:hypothetical protein